MSSDSNDGGNGNAPKVLLLGISYPDVKGHMDQHGYSDKLLIHKKLSVDQAVELVRRGILTEMDARDLARCVATEQLVEGGLKAYTVSKEVGGVYRNDRHVYGNFNNSRSLYNALTQNFGPLQFQQVILDYYWMPTGWLVTRWAKSLFQNTLPDLVRYKMLAFPTSTSRSQHPPDENNSNDINTPSTSADTNEEETEASKDAEGGIDTENNNSNSTIDLEEGVVFLPFCAHVCKELVGAIHILKKYYAITFVHKKELPGHALWKGTMEIDANVMQHRLGKRLDQEEIYCTFQPKDIYGSMEDSHINKEDVMKMLLSIESFKEIRMIRLRPLRQHGPPAAKGDAAVKPEVGGFIGLNWAMGRKRFKEFRSRKKAPPPRRLKPSKRRTVTSSEDDTDSESSLSSSDDDTSIEDEDDFGDGHFVDIDYDPYDPENIAETTNFYPYPTLDLVSYIDGKQIVNDDRVMDSWAETWGPKISRKKNRKQDIFQNHFQELHRQKTGHLSSNPRLIEPDAEEAMGYTWTLAEDGWNTTLNGDDPQWELIPKIVKTAKTDHTMTGCRLLFEMKNPGYKTLSRSYGYSSQMSCYQIPKTSVLAKIINAKDAEKTMEAKANKQQAAQRAAAESLIAFSGSSRDKNKGNNSVITSIDELSVEKIKKLDSKLLRAHLLAYGQEKVPHKRAGRKALLESLVQEHIKQTERLSLLTSVAQDYDPENVATAMLEQFADIAIVRGIKEVFDDPVETNEFGVREDLPPFTTSWRHIDYDLSDSDNFPRELYRLVQDAEALVITHMISWQEKGKSFAVHDKEGFEQRILRECTGDAESTFEAFVANLSSFGFSEIENGSRKGGYRHEFFRRKRPGDVALIARGDDDTSDGDDSVSDEASSVGNGSSNASASPSSTKEVNVYNLSRSNDFPKELHKLLEEAEEEGLAECFHWLPGGKSFGISDDEMFISKVLQVHSKNTTIASLEASLFNFGFKKIRKTKTEAYRRYQHSDFVKGKPEKLSGIKLRSDRKLVGTTRSISRNQKRPELKSKSRKRKTPEPQSKRTKERQVATSARSRGVEISTVASPMSSTEAVSPHQRRSNFAGSLRLLLANNEDSSVVSWLPDGAAFTVSKPEVFESSIIPKYFPSMPYPSFRRELKALGFEPFGTSADLKGIMYHGLFHRDFPDLWKLHDDSDLTEKVVYCLSQDRKLLKKLMDLEGESSSRGGKEKIPWEEFPALEDFLFNSIRRHFLLLIANSTKLQRELYTKLVKEALEIVKTQAYKLDEAIDDAQILGCLRIFFRSHFQRVRKQVQSMKISTEHNVKATLQSLIHRAEPMDLHNLEAADGSNQDTSCEGVDVGAPNSHKDGTIEVSNINHPATRINVTAQGLDESKVVDDKGTPMGGGKEPETMVAARHRGSSLANGMITDKAPKKPVESGQPSSKKRKAAPSSGKKSQAGSPRVKRKKGVKAAICMRAEQSVVSPGPQTVTSPARTGPMNGQMADFIGQGGNAIEGAALHSLETSLFQSHPSPATEMLCQPQGLPVAHHSTINEGEEASTKLVILTFPIKTLETYLHECLPGPQVNGFDLSGSSHVSNEEEMQCMLPVLGINTQVALQEHFPRLQIYIHLLRSMDGRQWFIQLLNAPLQVRMEYLYRTLMECFMTTDFQSRLLVNENTSDALLWRDVYEQLKAGRQLDHLQAQQHVRDQQVLQLLKNSSSPRAQLNLLNNQQSLQLHHLNDFQAAQQQLGSPLLQQHLQLNQLSNLTASVQRFPSGTNHNGGAAAAAANPRAAVSVATPSPPVDTYNRDQDALSRMNLFAAASANANASASGAFNNAFNNQM